MHCFLVLGALLTIRFKDRSRKHAHICKFIAVIRFLWQCWLQDPRKL